LGCDHGGLRLGVRLRSLLKVLQHAGSESPDQMRARNGGHVWPHRDGLWGHTGLLCVALQ
jgi:hypothetical protein